MFPKAGNAPGESTWIAEMSEGIAALEKEDASMEANKEGPWQEHDEDVKTINKLKTKKQRRKELKLKREEVSRTVFVFKILIFCCRWCLVTN